MFPSLINPLLSYIKASQSGLISSIVVPISNFQMQDKENLTLKQRFEAFRQRRIQELRNQKALKEQQNLQRLEPGFTQTLREKFLARAKQYQGVPYARRYHEPGSVHYRSSLFLDCCALIRQAVWDLREDFGFTLSRWNQAYQYDVLPAEIPFEEMKPGDLIFYSATFYDKRKKPQIHDMVHVEIFIGGPTGEQSLGARWQKGVVQVHDSYKFVSTSYYDIHFHYKSIQSWLAGTCTSHCQLHPWRDDRKDIWLPKGSIFAQEQAEQQAEQEVALENVFAIGPGNNGELVYDDMVRRGWTPLPSSHSYSSKCRLKWTQTHGEVDYFAFQEGVNLVNHFPNANFLFTSKTALSATARDLPGFPLPRTYDLSDPADLVRFLQGTHEGLWIVKPQCQNQGKGIRLVRDVEAMKQQVREGDKTDVVVQQYVHPPLLVEGRKFDFRMYLLIARCKPMRAFLFQDYYARLSLNQYDWQDSDLLTHLTNASQQKKHPNYSALKETSILAKADIGLSADQLSMVDDQVAAALSHLLQACSSRLVTKFGFFELFGVDVLLDSQLRVYILEINSNPALFVDTKAQAGVIPRLIHESLELVLRLHANGPETYEDLGFRRIYAEELISAE